MTILVDTICYAAGVVSTLSMSKGWSKWKKPKIEEPFSHKFLWEDYVERGHSYVGYGCPKCRSIACNGTDYPLCDDFCFPRSHFHYKCNSCKYEAIMRTADDK